MSGDCPGLGSKIFNMSECSLCDSCCGRKYLPAN